MGFPADRAASNQARSAFFTSATQETTQETTQELILSLLHENPVLTRAGRSHRNHARRVERTRDHEENGRRSLHEFGHKADPAADRPLSPVSFNR